MESNDSLDFISGAEILVQIVHNFKLKINWSFEDAQFSYNV